MLTGVASVWSEESIAWLRCRVSGVKLRAFPTRVEASKLVIVDLFVSAPKNKKHKSPASSPAGKGLPQLQYSIAEMMIRIGMAQRIVTSISGKESNKSTCSSPLSVGSDESFPCSAGSISIESSVQESVVTIGLDCKAVGVKDDNKQTDESVGTNTSTSSKDTVVQRPVKVLEKRPNNSDRSFQGRRNCEDDVFEKESYDERALERVANVGPKLEPKEHSENSIECIEVVHNGKRSSRFTVN